ncbi:MAG: site-2 protease family protein [Oscillospiraceae bacterium]|nr:site-2 protease family protein [Oscillospiraceae bacterium]
MPVISALILILILGVLITAHELGHFLAARLCGMRVREFAIGMGPVLYRRQKKDENGEPMGTKFSLRAFPVGGFCDLGEDEASDDPAHFRNKGIWQKVFMLVSGAAMNFLLGFLFFLILFSSVNYVAMPDITSLEPDFPYAGQIQTGDRFYSINGHRIYNLSDFYLFLGRDADTPYTFVMERGGERVTVSDVTRQLDGGQKFGFTVGAAEELTASKTLWHAGASTVDFVRLVWISLGDLISGAAGAGDLVGFVGLGGAVNEIISEEETALSDQMRQLLQLAGLVAVNLAVVNLLPIPALDGGRIFFLFISAFLVLVRKKPLSAKVEGYIHGVTMLLLFGLMIFIFFNDIRRLVGL